MAAYAFTSCPMTVVYGRSGYNKDDNDEDDKKCFGRSGYNKDDNDEDDKKCFGRSGYNKGGKKDGDDDDEAN